MYYTFTKIRKYHLENSADITASRQFNRKEGKQMKKIKYVKPMVIGSATVHPC